MSASWHLITTPHSSQFAYSAVPEVLSEWRANYMRDVHHAEVVVERHNLIGFVGRGMARITPLVAYELPDGRKIRLMEYDIPQFGALLQDFDTHPLQLTPAGEFIRISGMGPLIYLNRGEAEHLLRAVSGKIPDIRSELVAQQERNLELLARANGISLAEQKSVNETAARAVAAASNRKRGPRRTVKH